MARPFDALSDEERWGFVKYRHNSHHTYVNDPQWMCGGTEPWTLPQSKQGWFICRDLQEMYDELTDTNE